MSFEPDDPALLGIHAKRLIQRDIDQLLGICDFALMDGVIDQMEAEAILAWLNTHKECLDTWPASVLYDRLRTMMADGILDNEEQGELLGTILRITQPKIENRPIIPAVLPLDEPEPPIVFERRNFCFTGVFDFGARSECQSVTADQGGVCIKGITKKLDYLVIGNIGSDAWRHSSFGAKIAKAVDYRDSGIPISIVSESNWAAHLR